MTTVAPINGSFVRENTFPLIVARVWAFRMVVQIVRRKTAGNIFFKTALI
jgi:hypothetical protein